MACAGVQDLATCAEIRAHVAGCVKDVLEAWEAAVCRLEAEQLVSPEFAARVKDACARTRQALEVFVSGDVGATAAYMHMFHKILTCSTAAASLPLLPAGGSGAAEDAATTAVLGAMAEPGYAGATPFADCGLTPASWDEFTRVVAQNRNHPRADALTRVHASVKKTFTTLLMTSAYFAIEDAAMRRNLITACDSFKASLTQQSQATGVPESQLLSPETLEPVLGSLLADAIETDDDRRALREVSRLVATLGHALATPTAPQAAAQPTTTPSVIHADTL